MATNTYMLEYDAFIRSIKQNKNVSHAVLLGAGASILPKYSLRQIVFGSGSVIYILPIIPIRL